MSAPDSLFGHRVGFGRHPAVIAVDLSRAFTDPQSPLACDADAAVAASARVVEQARASNLPLIFTTTAYTPAMREAAAAFLAKTPALRALVPGDPLAKVDPRTGIRPDDPLVVKPFPSAFAGTSVAALLTAAGADTVVLVGASTSGCVRATAVDSVSNGFRTIVVREGVADRNATAHRQALEDMDGRYADVESLEAVIDHLRGLQRA